MSIALVNGKVVTPFNVAEKDVLIEGEKIVKIGCGVSRSATEVIDVKGAYILPGAIDTHTHFELDTGATVTADNFATGTKAALAGGTTMILDFATQNKGGTLPQALREWQKKALQSYCDYGFHMAITDWNEKTAVDMETVAALGVTSFKMYMAYKNVLQVDDDAIYEALVRSKEIGALIGFHCENGALIAALTQKALAENKTAPLYHAQTRPACLEQEAVHRLATIALLAKAPCFIVHLSTDAGLRTALAMREQGAEILLETCPQYLLLDESLYEKNSVTDNFEGAKYVMAPPLRTKSDQEALWSGLANSQINFIGTDHCSFNCAGQKELGRHDFSKIPNGSPGVEHRLHLMYTYGVCANKISLSQMSCLLATNAAQIFGLFPQKGIIQEGSDADLVVLDPTFTTTISAQTQLQNVDYTPYEGFRRQGKITHVFLRGQQAVQDEKILSPQPMGIYQPRNRRGKH
jgi:dihydropyrimidinase